MYNYALISTETGSIFLNNKTQAIRLKRSVRFPDDVTRLVAFKVFDEENDIIYVTTQSVHEKSKWELFEIFIKESKQIVKENKEISVFLNNKTQSIRIPVSMAIAHEQKNVIVEDYLLLDDADNEKRLKVLKIIADKG